MFREDVFKFPLPIDLLPGNMALRLSHLEGRPAWVGFSVAPPNGIRKAIIDDVSISTPFVLLVFVVALSLAFAVHLALAHSLHFQFHSHYRFRYRYSLQLLLSMSMSLLSVKHVEGDGFSSPLG